MVVLMISDWWDSLKYRWVGRRIRTKACEFAAVVLSTRKEDEALTPLAFSLAVFFETYMWSGSDACVDDFGPKGPVQLTVAGLVEQADTEGLNPSAQGRDGSSPSPGTTS